MEIKEQFKKIKKTVLSLFQVNKAISLKELRMLRALSRYQPITINFYGRRIKVVDALTFLSSYKEIFENEIYKFNTANKDITIIDCGANIGLSTIYLKMRFPNAHIVAYEPDPNIYAALKNNITAFRYKNITCLNEAVSNQDSTLNFWSEGGHSGMIVRHTDEKKTTPVKAIRLKSFLSNYKHITFLKIDIEGEEINVIPDIKDELKKIDYLFLEYHSFINKTQELSELLSFITEAGLRYHIKEATDKTYPFINKEIFLNMDMLINIFCYREHAIDHNNDA